jgi:MFS family permease
MKRDLQYIKFSAYGFIKNLRFFDPFIILFFRETGLSFFQIGSLISIREISTTLLEVPTGLIADAYGRRNAMVFAFLTYIVSFLVFYFVPNFYIYGVAMVFFAAGEAFRTGTHKAMIMDYMQRKKITDSKVEYYGGTRAWSQVGSAISALIAGVLVFYSGRYRIIFLASVFPYILGLLLMISYPRELNSRQSAGESAPSRMGILTSMKNTVLGFVGLLRDRSVMRALLNSSFYDGLFKSVKDYLQPILKTSVLSLPILISLQQDKRSTVVISLTYAVLFILTSISSRSAHRITKRFSTLAPAVNASYLIGVGLTILAGVLYGLGVSIATILVFVFLYLFMNFRRPLTVSYVSDYIETRVMATGLSVESQMKTVIVALLAPALGFVSDQFGIGIGIVSIGCIPLILFPFVRVLGAERGTDKTIT